MNDVLVKKNRAGVFFVDADKLMSEPYAVIRTASIRTFIQCAEYLIKNGNKPLRVMEFEKSGSSHTMAVHFTDFGVAFGLLEAIPLERKKAFVFRLSKLGLKVYGNLMDWEKELRAFHLDK